MLDAASGLVTFREPNPVRLVVARGWTGHGAEQGYREEQQEIRRESLAERGAAAAVQLQALPQIARARPDHRRIRRRSLRDRHLQPGRRATRLRHRLDHAADLSA